MKMIEKTRARRDRKLCPTVECGKGLTEQSHKNQCDINLILQDYTRTGFMKHANENQGKYDDVSGVDFQKSMETVANVKSLFEGLPSQIRKEFNQDATQFLNYVQNPANNKALLDRGIIKGNDGIDISGAYTKAPTQKPADSGGESSSASELSSPETQPSESAVE